MNQDPNEMFQDAFSVPDQNPVVNDTLAKLKSNNLKAFKTPSKQLLSSSKSIINGTLKTANALQRSIEERKKENLKIPKEELMNHIMSRLAGGLKGQDDMITTEKIDEIGIALIESYCSLDAAARKLGMTTARLKWLIREVPELEVYFEIAHEGIKQLTDAEIIRKLQLGDEDTVKMVFNKMYAGRARGGYNIAELGTRGYKDPLAKELAAETEKDRSKGNVNVQFNFIQKDIRTEHIAVEAEGAIIETNELDDGEFST